MRNRAKKSSFLCLCYILRATRAGRCRERRYADHIYSDVLQNAPFRSQIFFASGGKGALTPLTKILRMFLDGTVLSCLAGGVSRVGSTARRVRSVSGLVKVSGGSAPPASTWAPLLESEPSLPTAGPKLLNSTKNHNVRCRINKF